ncbi:hypothetical protein SAVIM338S_02267 [Streptomyces avidinii]
MRIPNSAETRPPKGQAYAWYRDVVQEVPLSGMLVARQIARLCGDDSKVSVPWRSLADAVGRKDKGARKRAFTERGAQTLTEAGRLRIATVGEKRGAVTTFYLL